MNTRTYLAAAMVAMFWIGAANSPAQAPSTFQPRQPSPLAGPTKAVTEARVALEKAKSQLLVIRKRVEITFASKPEFKAAKDAVDAAKQNYDRVSRRVLSKLQADPAYKDLLARRDKAEATLALANRPSAPTADDSGKISDADLAAAGQERTDVGIAMKKMESEALDNNAEYGAAKQKLADARAAWEALEPQVDDAVKIDPEYPATQQNIESAQQAYDQAKEQLASAAKAQREAAAAASRSRSTTHTPYNR